jgi:hypothetical protein
MWEAQCTEMWLGVHFLTTHPSSKNN